MICKLFSQLYRFEVHLIQSDRPSSNTNGIFDPVCNIGTCTGPYAGYTKGGLHQRLHHRYSVQFHVM